MPTRQTPSPAPQDDLEPPWRRPPARVRRPAPLSRELIVEAALDIVDREGVDALSMRRVADELDTGASSLYAHIRNKEELVELLLDRVLGELDLPDPDPSDWQGQIKAFARQARALMIRHNDIAKATLGRIPMGPNALHWMEWSLTLLRGAGIPDRTAAYVGDLFGLLLGAYAYEEALGVQSPTGEEMSPERYVEMVHGYWSSLPADRFPNIVELVDVLLSGDNDERFEFFIDIVVAGLAAQTPATRKRRSR
jgi:AcrR family transcriptional regulator